MHECGFPPSITDFEPMLAVQVLTEKTQASHEYRLVSNVIFDGLGPFAASKYCT